MFFIQQDNYGGQPHNANKKSKRLRHKPKPPHRPSFIPFPFAFFIRLRWETLLKIHIMQKQLRIITSKHLSVCPVSSLLFPVPVIESSFFSRHFRRRRVYCRPLPGTSVFHIKSSGWYIWCFPSGRRQFAALPF